jgi:uncharacterized SAM-binding protein YcdF (DUF218 family)
LGRPHQGSKVQTLACHLFDTKLGLDQLHDGLMNAPLADFVKSYFIPGSTLFLVIVSTPLIACILLARDRIGRAAAYLMALTVTAYWALSLPILSDAIGASLPAHLTATPVGSSPRAIVVLGAGVARYSDANGDVTVPLGQTALNALDGARLYRERGLPIVASGGAFDVTIEQPESVTLRQILVKHGVPSDRIVEESTSRTTREQALAVAPLLRAHGWNPVLLVSSPVHLLRARGAFAAMGIDAIPAPASFRSTHFVFTRRWTPTPEALASSENSMYDYLAWPYYWAAGWLRARP